MSNFIKRKKIISEHVIPWQKNKFAFDVSYFENSNLLNQKVNKKVKMIATSGSNI